MWNSELQRFGISPQFWLKLSRGDEGVGHVCFPWDEGVGRALTRVPLCADERRASLIHRTAAKLGTVYIFLDTKSY